MRRVQRAVINFQGWLFWALFFGVKANQVEMTNIRKKTKMASR